MKKIVPVMAIMIATSLTSCYNRIGKLIIISTRNMDSHTDYVLLEKEVKGVGKKKKGEALEIAVDKAVKKFSTGEFMKNVIVQVSANGKKVRVIGDVWGTPPPADKK